jgi:hypothetical protein
MKTISATENGLKISILVSHKELRKVMDQAQSRYWLDSYHYMYGEDTGTIVLHRPKGSVRDGCNVPAIKKIIGPVAIANALVRMAEGTCDRYGSNVKERFADFLKLITDEGLECDSSLFDDIIQVAAFGYIAYA